MQIIDTLIEERQYHILKQGIGFMMMRSLKEDITHQSPQDRSEYQLFERLTGRRKSFLDDQFLRESGVFFPEKTDWKYYVSLFGGQRDLALVHSLYPQKELVVNETCSDMFDIYRSLRDEPRSFMETYNKVLSLIPKATDSYSKVSSFYQMVKTNFQENYGSRTAVDNSALLLFLLHYSDSTSPVTNRMISENNEPYRGSKYWENKIQLIREWKKLLQHSHLWHTDYQNVVLPEKKCFVYCNTPPYSTQISTKDDNSVEWSHRHLKTFRTYINELAANSNHYICASNLLNTSFRKMINEDCGWMLTSVDPKVKKIRNQLRPEMFISNYNLNGLQPISEAKDVMSFGLNTSYVMEYTKSYDRFLGALI